jgi:hypothetical protein
MKNLLLMEIDGVTSLDFSLLGAYDKDGDIEEFRD